MSLFFSYICHANNADMRVIQYIILATALLAASCKPHKQSHSRADMVVSIPPLKYIVESIVGEDFTTQVLLPAGASPETYEPTPRQVADMSNAKMIFSTGLIAFEKALLERVGKQGQVVNLSEGIDLIKGDCHSDHSHACGADPHIWTSPRELRTMAHNAYRAIQAAFPDSVKYEAAYRALDERLALLDSECRAKCDSAEVKAFIIYHPALTYYARSYGIEQISIENEGKEPSAKYIAYIIDKARESDIRQLLYQIEFPRSAVEVISEDMGGEAIEINPLEENPVEFIKHITRIITQ